MSIEKIFNMPKNCDKIDDMIKPYYPEDDIRNSDPSLFYRGYDGREYYTTDELYAANKQYNNERYANKGNQPASRIR